MCIRRRTGRRTCTPTSRKQYLAQKNENLLKNENLVEDNKNLFEENKNCLKCSKLLKKPLKCQTWDLILLKKMWETADSKFDFKRYIASRKAKVEYKTALAQEIAQRVTLQCELKGKASASQETNEEENMDAFKFEKNRKVIQEIESKLPEEDEERVPTITVLEGGRCVVVDTDSENSARSDAD